jgi:hypothetical protein
MAIYYPERSAILPAGTVVEHDVRALDGYAGANEPVNHIVDYPASDLKREAGFR